ncbi:hypothetical protein [Candidatus Harpocratesius sp.]
MPKTIYLRKFRSIPQNTFRDFSENNISKREWEMLQLFLEFKRYFIYIFELNDLSYFDDLQNDLEINGTPFKGIFLYDIIAIELFRRQLEFKDFTGIEKLSYFLSEHPFKGIVHDQYYFRTVNNISYILNLIPSDAFIKVFHKFEQEAIDLGIIILSILLYDCQFVHGNCNNNYKDEDAKQAKRYNDPDADLIGITVSRRE